MSAISWFSHLGSQTKTRLAISTIAHSAREVEHLRIWTVGLRLAAVMMLQ